MKPEFPLRKIEVAAYTIPTDAPESDGTLAWDSTTIVVVHAHAGDQIGMGYSYAPPAVARFISDSLIARIEGRDAMAIAGAHQAMRNQVRNTGEVGQSAMAVAAVDNALWDLKARLLGVPLVTLFGAVRSCLPIYGSGGFCSYSDQQLTQQLGDWAAQGITRVKMKVGRDPQNDRHRAQVARDAIGPNVELFVDANSAYARKQALYWCETFAGEFDARWMEQPLDPTDVFGMAWLREVGPARLEIADGEYAYDLPYFKRRLEANAVDVLQADATRCGGFSDFLGVGALCQSYAMPMSSHCAPALHLHIGCALPAMRHAEYFHDHVRIEQMLFDGAATPQGGALWPDLSRPGMGLEFKKQDAEKFRVEV